MSFQDIKEHYTEIQINGDIYKICYDFSSIGSLMERFNKPFHEAIALGDVLSNGTIDDYIDFCYIGFKKYQPDMSRELICDYPFISSLIVKCSTTYSKVNQEPEQWAKIVYNDKPKGDEPKKKGLISRLIGFITRQ